MQLNIRINEETRRELDAIMSLTGDGEGEIVRRWINVAYNKIAGMTLEQLHSMAKEALENWDEDAADDYYKPATKGLRYILKHKFNEDEIREHVKGPADWDGLQDWAVFFGS